MKHSVSRFVAYLRQGSKQKGDNQNGNYCTKWNERGFHSFIVLCMV